jgi:protease YdgD
MRGNRILRRLLVAASLLAAMPAWAGDPAIDPARPNVDASVYPWSAFGRVNRDGRAHCTGVMIAESLALTAAHCLFDRRTHRWVAPRYVHFVAGYQRETYLAHSVARRYHVGSARGATPAPIRPERQEDWAVLELEAPIGRQVGYIGWAVLDTAAVGRLIVADAELVQAGYRRDRAHMLTADRDCRLRAMISRAGPLLAHDCTSTFGDSGGPLLLWHEGTPLAVAINLGQIKAPQGPVNTALSLVALEEQLGSLAGPVATLAQVYGLRGRLGRQPR